MRYLRVCILLVPMLFCQVPVWAQDALNAKADNIVGLYQSVQNGMPFRAKIEKVAEGVYAGRVVWMERERDAEGNLLLDARNPDRQLRATPLNRVVLFKGLRHDARRGEWGGCKIYDPYRGIRAKLTARFDAEGRLGLKGSLMGFSETVYWNKVE